MPLAQVTLWVLRVWVLSAPLPTHACKRRYHLFVTLLGGDEYDAWHVLLWTCVYRLCLLFLVLVVSATYTANLTVFLMRPSFDVLWQHSLQDLRAATACVLWLQYEQILLPYFPLGCFLFAPANLTLPASQAWTRSALSHQSCDCIVEIVPIASVKALVHCS